MPGLLRSILRIVSINLAMFYWSKQAQIRRVGKIFHFFMERSAKSHFKQVWLQGGEQCNIFQRIYHIFAYYREQDGFHIIQHGLRNRFHWGKGKLTRLSSAKERKATLYHARLISCPPHSTKSCWDLDPSACHRGWICVSLDGLCPLLFYLLTGNLKKAALSVEKQVDNSRGIGFEFQLLV